MNLEIYDTSDSIFVEKDNHTKVNYFLFDEYEIHLNTIHTLENRSDHEVRFLVYRMVPDGISKREMIKNDKELVKPEI